MDFDTVFDFVYSMALSDAMNRVSGAGEKERIAECDDIKQSVRTYARMIIFNENAVTFNDTINNILAYAEAIPVDFSFGKAQKLVNMTMKYLYMKYYDDANVLERYSECDAPMDSIIKDFVYVSYFAFGLGEDPGFPRNCSWSKIGEERYPITFYSAFQTAIDSLINYANNNHLNIHNRVEFDYLFWKKAKRLRTTSSIQNQELLAQEIWTEMINL